MSFVMSHTTQHQIKTMLQWLFHTKQREIKKNCFCFPGNDSNEVETENHLWNIKHKALN